MKTPMAMKIPSTLPFGADKFIPTYTVGISPGAL